VRIADCPAPLAAPGAFFSASKRAFRLLGVVGIWSHARRGSEGGDYANTVRNCLGME
jgi:hypothetical protein